MKRRHALRGLVVLASLACLPGADAQSGSTTYVVGLLDAGERLPEWAAFRQQLRDLGYVEGRDVKFEPRYAKGSADRLAASAKELVQLKVDVIVTSGAAAAVAAQRVTRRIPIVMATGTDQVSLGLAATLAHPGANVTGVSSINSELTAKRLDLMRELVPRAGRVGALWHADNSPSMTSVRDLEASTDRFRLAFQSFGVRSGDEVGEAFEAMRRERIDCLIVVSGPLMYYERNRIIGLAAKYRIPAIYGAAEYVEAGGLLSYGPSYPDLARHAAVYVDKILKGANPGDLPIEQATTFELVINAKTARALGVVVGPAMLARADRVVQ